MEHFNRLTPAEAERLALLAEECGEVMQAIGKVLRHGFESTHPDGGPTNREALERECGDVYHAIWRLIGAGDIDGNGMSQRADDKAKSVVRYLHHQGHNVAFSGVPAGHSSNHPAGRRKSAPLWLKLRMICDDN